MNSMTPANYSPKTWVRALVALYRHLPVLVTSLDNQMLSTAMSTVSARLCHIAQNDIRVISDKMIDLSQRKITFLNLKIITDSLLLTLPPMWAKTVVLSEFDGLSILEISKILQISERTVSRCKNYAMEKMAEKLEENAGYSNLLKSAAGETCVHNLLCKFRSSHANHPFHSSHDAVSLAFA